MLAIFNWELAPWDYLLPGQASYSDADRGITVLMVCFFWPVIAPLALLVWGVLKLGKAVENAGR